MDLKNISTDEIPDDILNWQPSDTKEPEKPKKSNNSNMLIMVAPNARSVNNLTYQERVELSKKLIQYQKIMEIGTRNRVLIKSGEGTFHEISGQPEIGPTDHKLHSHILIKFTGYVQLDLDKMRMVGLDIFGKIPTIRVRHFHDAARAVENYVHKGSGGGPAKNEYVKNQSVGKFYGLPKAMMWKV